MKTTVSAIDSSLGYGTSMNESAHEKFMIINVSKQQSEEEDSMSMSSITGSDSGLENEQIDELIDVESD